MKYFCRDHLHLIEEGYEKLAKTISVSLLNAHPYTHDNAKQSNYPPLKHSTICEAPSKPPILDSHLPESDRKENIPNRTNIFIVKPIRCSIQEVVAESFAAQNVWQWMLLELYSIVQRGWVNSMSWNQQAMSTQANLKRRRRLLWTWNEEVWRIKHRTRVDWRWKRHYLRHIIFAFLHFLTYIIVFPKLLGSLFSKPATLYAFFLIVPFASSNFINLNRDHKNIVLLIKDHLRRY